MTAVLPLVYAVGVVAVTIFLSLAICGGLSRRLRRRRQPNPETWRQRRFRRRFNRHARKINGPALLPPRSGPRIVNTYTCGCEWHHEGGPRADQWVPCRDHADPVSVAIETEER